MGGSSRQSNQSGNWFYFLKVESRSWVNGKVYVYERFEKRGGSMKYLLWKLRKQIYQRHKGLLGSFGDTLKFGILTLKWHHFSFLYFLQQCFVVLVRYGVCGELGFTRVGPVSTIEEFGLWGSWRATSFEQRRFEGQEDCSSSVWCICVWEKLIIGGMVV